MVRKTNLLLCVATLLGLAGLVGCASSISANQNLLDGEGAVVFRVITNDAQRSVSPTSSLNRIVLQRVSPSDETDAAGLILERTREVTYDSAVFSGALKAGRYKLLHATGMVGAGPYVASYTFPLTSAFDTFEVRKGEVSLLGTLLIQPTDGANFRLGYLPPDAELIETFERLFPAVAVQTRGKPMHTFEMTPELNQAVSNAPKFKLHSVAVNGLWQNERGDFFAGSRMGVALWKKAGQHQWRELDLGTWREVLTLRPYADGLLAGGEEGLLRYSTDDGKTWKQLPPPDQGVIYSIDVLSNGKVIALVRRGAEWSLHSSDDPRVAGWRKLGVLDGDNSAVAALRKLQIAPSEVYGATWWPPRMVLSGSTAGLMTRGGDFHLMDIESGGVEHLPPLIVKMRGLSTLADGTLVLRGEGLGLYTYLSGDGGRTWSEVKTSGVGVFKDKQHGYDLKRSSVAATRDGGKTWSSVGKDNLPWRPYDVRDVAIDRADDSLLVVLFNSAMYRSADEGLSWTRER